VICALIAAFTFAGLVTPALAKKEFKREFEASGPEVKLTASGLGEQKFQFPFEEKSSIKVTCTEVAATGEIKTVEGKASGFVLKTKYSGGGPLGGCYTKGKKKQRVEVIFTTVEWEFHADGTASIINEPKVEVSPICTIVLTKGQTVGKEEVGEGKKGPETYKQVGKSAPEGQPQVEIQTKTHTHETGETNGLEYSGEGALCETGEFKEEGGKLKGKMIVSGKAKETWIGFKEELIA
jgi:hypothetical protein